MATIKKTFTTRLDNIVVLADGVRATVSLIDSDDGATVTAHMLIAIKDGKVVQPPVPAGSVIVDPSIGTAASTLMSALAKLVDQVVSSQTIFIRGSVPPAQLQRPQP